VAVYANHPRSKKEGGSCGKAGGVEEEFLSNLAQKKINTNWIQPDLSGKNGEVWRDNPVLSRGRGWCCYAASMGWRKLRSLRGKRGNGGMSGIM